MNCHEARERLSDLVDKALAARERAEVGAHLENCPDCRRELDHLRATVSLLSRVERPRAPMGFVDQVTAAANLGSHLAQWSRRIGRRLFLPMNIKLPVHAAAMLLVAVLGVYLLQSTPELRDAARPDLQSKTARSQPSGRSVARTTPSPPPALSLPDLDRKDRRGARVDSENASEAGPQTEPEAENTIRGERPLDSPKSAPAAQVAPAPAAPPAELWFRATKRDAVEGQPGAPAPVPPAMSARRQSAPSSVVGRLNVKNRPAAEQGLANLLARLGGTETGRRQELGATVVEVLVPESRYTDFVSGLTSLGAFTPEGQPVALPTQPPQFRLSIRISE